MIIEVKRNFIATNWPKNKIENPNHSEEKTQNQILKECIVLRI